MKHRNATAMLAMLLALASSQAGAATTRPLRLNFVAPPERAAPARVERAGLANAQPESRADSRRGVPLHVADNARLRQQALENILDPPSPALPALDENPAGGQMQLRFQKRGNAFRDLSKGYREMCDRASAKIWDDPNGKRVRFDVRGKPGIGIEIPIR